jgi:hypothetical protein
MKQTILIGVVVACLLSTGAEGEDVRSHIKDVVQSHPRLFLKPGEGAALREKIESNSTLSDALAHVLSTSDVILGAQPVERRKVGKRLLGVSRTCLKRVLYLSFAYRVTRDKRYAVRAQKEMLAAAAFSDWIGSGVSRQPA